MIGTVKMGSVGKYFANRFKYISMVMTKKGYFRVTLVEFAPFARAGATGKRSVYTGWASFFCHFVRVFEQHLDLSFCEVFEMQTYS